MSGGGGGPVNPTRCKEKPWDLWVSEVGRESPLHDEPAGRKPPPTRRRSGVSLLRYGSMRLHGQFPQMDNLNAVVCHMCGATVKCSSAYRHLATYHSVSEPALPPPAAPYVKLKTHSRSKHKKEVAQEADRSVEPVRTSLPTPVYYAEQEPKSVSLPMPVPVPVVGGVQVCVEELPVVSIQDPDDLPLDDNTTDDIVAIMNSQGIQSAEDPDQTVLWNNIIDDISTLQDINFPQLNSEFSTVSSLPTYKLAEDFSNVQYSTSVPAPLPPVVDAVALAPAPVMPAKSSRSKTKSKFNSREYDPNKHCGVITVETKKPCTRSLTCKAHTLSLRRLVEGRVKPFDALLAEHKAAREAAALGTATLVQPAPAPAPEPAPLTLTIPPSLLVNPSIDFSSYNIATEQQVTDIYTSLLGGKDSSVLQDTSAITSLLSQALPPEQFLITENPELSGEVPILSIASPVEPAPPPEPVILPSRLHDETLPSIVPTDVCWYAAPPRPLALCTFNATHAGGAVILGRKFATVRGNIKSSLSRSQGKVVSGSNNYYNFSQNSSLSKTVQLNNANKCSKAAVRRLIVCSGTSAKTDFAEEYARINGHTLPGSSGKRSAIDSLDCEAKRAASTSRMFSATSHAHTVKSLHSAHTSADMLELMLDPLVADENC